MYFHQSIHAHSLNKVWLNRVLDAREKDLTSSAFYTTSDLELYCEYTSSSLLYLTLQTLGKKRMHVCMYVCFDKRKHLFV